jgi:hypothetical protein
MRPLTGQSLQLACPCGWQDSLPASAGGLAIECPKCGRNLRAPGPGAQSSESLADIAVVERLTGRRFLDAPPSLRPLFVASSFTILVCAALALVFSDRSPAILAASIGGACAWTLGLLLAWRGADKQAAARQGARSCALDASRGETTGRLTGQGWA